jgi:hypothetical protein
MPRGDNDPVNDLSEKLLFLLEVELGKTGEDVLAKTREVSGDGFPLLPFGPF